MDEKIKVAFIYKKNYVFLTETHFDNTTYYFFMHALKRNPKLDVTYFQADSTFDTSQLKDKFDIILIPNNNNDGTPELLGIQHLKIPVISRTGDPHYAKKYDQFQFHDRYKIDYYFNFMHYDYFHKFYPKYFRYKTIIFGLETSLYQNLIPFKDRIKDKILNSGAVGKPSLKSKIANKILNPKSSAWYFYNLRTKCNDLPYVEHFSMLGNKYINDNYPKLLSRYRSSIAATTFYPTIKYFEVPAAGCLTFMEITKTNMGEYLGFVDGKTSIFINEKNYESKFEEYLSSPDNPIWENIADAGRKYVINELNNDRGVELLVELMEQLI